MNAISDALRADIPNRIRSAAAQAARGQHDEAVAAYRAVLAERSRPRVDALVGLGASLAALGHFAESRDAFVEAIALEPPERAVLLRLYELEQILGNADAAVAYLEQALAASRLVSTEATLQPPTRTVLALFRPGLFESNTPIDMIVDTERTTVHRYFIDEAGIEAASLPPFDLMLNAVAESDAAREALSAAARFAEEAKCACINRPAVVSVTGREQVAAKFQDSQNVFIPPITRMTRAALGANATLPFPFVIRPVGSQAGIGLAKIDEAADLVTYLAQESAPEFFVTMFVDYRNADGLYRKYRIIFVNGKPFAYHLAISPRWMIHYYNAPMLENAWMRAEEERFVDDVQAVFGSRRLTAGLAEIAEKIALEYFGIDCSIAPDGRLLLFEADSAMLVHGTDDPALFGYKLRSFKRIQTAFHQMLDTAIANSRAADKAP